MSTETQAPETIIPGEETEVVGGASSWRFAKGKIVRGQEIVEEVVVAGKQTQVATGTYPEERTSATGVLRRVWEFDGQIKDRKVHQIEADIETRDSGVMHLKASLLGANGEFKISLSALNFIWCLLQYVKDAPIRLETKQGDPIKLPNGQDGGKPTYVNAFELKDGKFYPIYRPKRDKNAPKVSMEDQWFELIAEFRKHPAWAAREIPVDTDTHFGQLCLECQAKGWPSPDQATPEWLTMIAGAFKHPVRASLRDYSEDEWGAVREALKQATAMPPALAEAAARVGTPAATAETPKITAGAFG